MRDIADVDRRDMDDVGRDLFERRRAVEREDVEVQPMSQQAQTRQVDMLFVKMREMIAGSSTGDKRQTKG
jgi:hypothetical protein